MKFSNAPDPTIAIKLLKEIAARKIVVGPQKVDRPLALYGAGDLGRMAKEYFDKIGIEVEYVVDILADMWRDKEPWQGTRVLFPEEVSVDQKNNHMLAVCIVKIPFAPLADGLLGQGWQCIVPFYDIAEAYRDYHPLGNGWFAEPIDSTDMDNISNVLDIWSDDISRAHHLQFIAWRLLREEWVFEDAPVNTENRFFIPEILDVLSEQESFADVGAHHGKVTLKFMDVIKNNFETVWMIEPDSLNLRKLRSSLSELDPATRSKLQILSNVVGRGQCIRRFYEGLDYASQLSDLGATQVGVTTIDDMNISPTFIKLHLEGGELATLQGAVKTILKYRPIITATSYHNDNGIWKLPKWMMENLSDYRFYTRLHSWCGTGAVLYGIPRERHGNI